MKRVMNQSGFAAIVEYIVVVSAVVAVLVAVVNAALAPRAQTIFETAINQIPTQ